MDREARRIVDELIARRDYLNDNKPDCPYCAEDCRIVLANCQTIPAVWRCETCKRQFTHEPKLA